LREWMGLANFERTLRRDRTFTGAGGPIRIRKLNEDVLAAFREIERRAYAIALTGCDDAEMSRSEISSGAPVARVMPIRVGMAGFFPKITSPCATKQPRGR